MERKSTTEARCHLGGIIDAHQDEADIQKLNSQRAVMPANGGAQKERRRAATAEQAIVREISKESARDQAAQQLRRQQETQRLSRWQSGRISANQ